MTTAKNPEVGLLDRDRVHRTMMQMGSRQLRERLCTYHPKIVAHLRSLPNAQPVEKDD